ncbi:endospore germination permease [Paenibacillus sp. MBLB4367]|uniref:GerAB/ArcD/ProY family transporter n=1 Tax=Paenibacillus sp. MBLB4367 TaxID=3384767 RepID=UPI003907F6EE
MSKINTVQLFMLVMMSAGLMNHVTLIPILLSVSGRDAWVAAVANVIPYLLWIWLLVRLIKAKGERPLFDWLSSKAGKAVAWILTSVMCLNLFVQAFLTLQETIVWTISSYLPGSSQMILACGLVIVSSIAANVGLQAIAITAGILLPGVVLLGFFVAGANIPNKDYGRLLPVTIDGLKPVWRGMMYAGAAYMELFLVFLLSHRISSKIRYRHMALLGLILVGLTLGPLMGAIAEFGPEEAARLRYPAFEQWRLIHFKRYLEHLDTFSIYQWLSGAFIRISICLFMIGELLPIQKAKTRSTTLIALSVALLLCIAIPLTDYDYFRFIVSFVFPSAFLLLLAATAVLSILTLLKRGGASHEQQP